MALAGHDRASGRAKMTGWPSRGRRRRTSAASSAWAAALLLMPAMIA